MGTTLKQAGKALPGPAWRGLPPKMRVLYITTRHRTGGWLAEAFTGDSASKVELHEAVGSAAGLAMLRDEPFDAVLVSHEPNELDAIELTEAYRASGAEEPLIVLGHESEQEMAAVSFEAGADGFVCVHTATTRHLIWVVARAMQRHLLIRENRRLHQVENKRLQREHDEAEQLLGQQRALISDLEALSQAAAAQSSAALPEPAAVPEEGCEPTLPSGPEPECLPEPLVEHYRELLRTYVIMGSGNLAGELDRLAGLLALAGISARQTMQLHVHVLAEMVHGLGARSTRHVMTRADLLILEIMIRLAECYRTRYQERAQPPVQQLLPGFGG